MDFQCRTTLILLKRTITLAAMASTVIIMTMFASAPPPTTLERHQSLSPTQRSLGCGPTHPVIDIHVLPAPNQSVAVDIDALIQQSDLIVMGTLSDEGSSFETKDNSLFTPMRITKASTLKNSTNVRSSGGEWTILAPGGLALIDGKCIKESDVADALNFRGRYVIFATYSAALQAYVSNFWFQIDNSSHITPRGHRNPGTSLPITLDSVIYKVKKLSK